MARLQCPARHLNRVSGRFRQCFNKLGFSQPYGVISSISRTGQSLGIGTVVPVSSYGSVTRDYQMHLTAGSGDLPRLIMDIEGWKLMRRLRKTGCAQRQGCNSSGFRNEQGVD